MDLHLIYLKSVLRSHMLTAFVIFCVLVNMLYFNCNLHV
jgi:hypothetical protein